MGFNKSINPFHTKMLYITKSVTPETSDLYGKLGN